MVVGGREGRVVTPHDRAVDARLQSGAGAPEPPGSRAGIRAPEAIHRGAEGGGHLSGSGGQV